ncbi:PQQ-dependent dehydrogenase, methanol/ethanol family [Novosphingobium malaysiense]|uniref:Alcohol dehydrogenase n=1 Tax=Novosphingobium malaysiense TaxID=1348853 RepID=A0A0B1ZQ97_9SPHN|nr:PQQ-dependent dehydrogenase, methanol/ethanol family [Novosphingobium malaysiense]KHK92761.1 alcohol dehydrogenase [Novosphingobium malaysiense]
MKPSSLRFPLGILAILALLSCARADTDTSDALVDPDNWTGFGRTTGEQHFSPLDEINSDNAGQLGLAWSMDLPPGNSVSAPLAIDGVLYTATGYSVVRAINAATGKLLWEFDPKVPEAAGSKLRQGWGIRGLAYGEGKLYVGTHDGRLLAINPGDGSLAWSSRTVPQDNAAFISGPPRYFDGKVIIGFGGADVSAVRGYVTAYDAKTGKQLWRFWTVPGNPKDGFENKAMEMAAKTWSGEWWKYGGGGTVWNAMTYDRSTGSIIIGVGNGSPWNHKVRSAGEGDNLFLASIVALDADTGAYKWHYQVNPGESWDYNASMDMELADLDIGGKRRQVLMTAPKNGFFYVIDRTNGKLISAEPFVKVTWAKRIDLNTGRPVEDPDARYPDGKTFVMWPSPVGAHTWLPMAYSPRSRLVYIPAIEMATSYNDVGITRENWTRAPGNAVDGAANPDFVVADAGPTNATSSLLAWDPVKQSVVWKVPNPGPWNGGVMTTGGNLVFQGRIDGTFNAYAADSGRKVWSFAAQAPVTAPPITYSANGRQYVTVLTGMGTSGSAFGVLLPVSIDYRTQARRILTFTLDGKAVLPRLKPEPLAPVADPGFVPDASLQAKGLVAFARHCAVCHGVNTIAAGHAPDLRASPMPQDKDAFRSIVREGALVPNGMPRFEEFDDRQLAELAQYIRGEAARWRAAPATEKPQR